MADIERRLRELGRSIDWPQTPAFGAPVPDRPPARPPRLRRARLAAATAGLALLALAGAALAFPSAREAVLDRLGIGGVEVRRVPQAPRVPRPDLGPRVSLADARARVPFRLARLAGAGPPDAVHLRVGRRGPEVTLVHGELLLTQVEGSGAPVAVSKEIGPGTSVDPVLVRGERGAWIAGDPHGAGIAGGALRLAGDTLVWERRGTVVRLEGARTREHALALARSVR